MKASTFKKVISLFQALQANEVLGRPIMDCKHQNTLIHKTSLSIKQNQSSINLKSNLVNENLIKVFYVDLNQQDFEERTKNKNLNGTHKNIQDQTNTKIELFNERPVREKDIQFSFKKTIGFKI